MLRSTLVALMVAPLIALGADDEPARVERDELQGTWVAVRAYKTDGEEVPPEVLKEADQRMTISGDKMTNTMKGRSVSFRIALDPSKSPMEIDWFSERRPPLLGIYREERHSGNRLGRRSRRAEADEIDPATEGLG